MAGRRAIALGTVVDSDGLVLTKASEMRGSLGCKLVDGTILEARVIGVHPASDLALLKIDAENLNVAQWSDEPPPVTGRWLATPKGSSNDRPTIGVVSVNDRKIPPSSPFIGIEMVNLKDGPGVRIKRVIANSPADYADLLVNDVIVSIDETEVKDNLSVKKALGQYDVNDRITVGILRGEKKLNIRLTLAEKDKVSPDNRRSNQQNSMGSVLSRRRKDFPTAFQHDSMLSSRTCGGPIVDLSGKIVGINIARAGRVSSLALPAYKVREIVELLKTGDLAPEVVNKEAIEKISAELEDMNTKYGYLPGKKAVLERKYNAEKARMDELNKSVAELKKRLKLIEEKSNNYNAELTAVRKQIINIEKTRQRLEADREQLRNGSR
jgi:serine protease Do